MNEGAVAGVDLRLITALTCLMFFMFAMTTDSVGLIIPEVIREFHLSLTAAGSLQYGSMTGIALAGLCLGFLADRIGRRRTILLGLAIFAVTSYLFPSSRSFTGVLALTTVAGAAIGIFKTGALSLVADSSLTATDLTAKMNLVEGCFGVGAIAGPLIVTQLIHHGVSWRWLYVIAGTLCVLLALLASVTRYPPARQVAAQAPSLPTTLRLVGDRYALGFSLGAFSYVVVESAVYVWMPTLLSSDARSGALAVAYALPAFFVMRAAGRFAGAWLLRRIDWSAALALCGVAILGCFLAAVMLGTAVAAIALPVSGLFMSIIYPTLNSKGIGCFPACESGAVAGIVLFFTCGGAFLGPLLMGLCSDLLGGPGFGFMCATVFAALLALGLLANWILKPAHGQLAHFAMEPGSP